MIPSRVLRAAHGYVPLIRFKGHHAPPQNVDHTPQPHPASPQTSLPDSFASYRQKSQQHGPLGGHKPSSSLGLSGGNKIAYGAIGGQTGHQLGTVAPADGQVWDRSELPARFGRLAWSEGEIEAVETGGASLW